MINIQQKLCEFYLCCTCWQIHSGEILKCVLPDSIQTVLSLQTPVTFSASQLCWWTLVIYQMCHVHANFERNASHIEQIMPKCTRSYGDIETIFILMTPGHHQFACRTKYQLLSQIPRSLADHFCFLLTAQIWCPFFLCSYHSSYFVHLCCVIMWINHRSLFWAMFQLTDTGIVFQRTCSSLMPTFFFLLCLIYPHAIVPYTLSTIILLLLFAN